MGRSEELIHEAEGIVCSTARQADILRRLINEYRITVAQALRLEATVHQLTKHQ